ncbi:hypothetical protein EVAR_6322_1 [Eumeta japonica]|uniref:Uncharacterized protein n=1 Tax=Eumeta variegata TaxID=151549 RepID=A0A4C1T8E8_EUMVA|nr:hypothetical protein EVAR_6322_1 [Eumeta japonica]
MFFHVLQKLQLPETAPNLPPLRSAALGSSLLSLQVNPSDKRALQGVCLFIAVTYLEPWLGCSLAVKASNQDLCFLKRLKEYETVDKLISKAALNKFSQHLWY